MTVRRWHPFMFYNELDWLECQLTETYDQVAGYVLVEATLDHQGHPKPLWYEKHKARYAQWADKIHHIIVTDLPTVEESADHWDRERKQRDAAMPWLREHTDPGDLILNLDVDEIPSAVTLAIEVGSIHGLSLSNHLYAVDWFAEWNVMGTLIPAQCLNHSGQSSELSGAVLGGLSWIREHRNGYPIINTAGWHFSWVGGPAEYSAKDKRSPHVEHSAERMAPGVPEHAYREGGGQLPVEVGDDWPVYIRERRCPDTWFRPRA